MMKKLALPWIKDYTGHIRLHYSRKWYCGWVVDRVWQYNWCDMEGDIKNWGEEKLRGYQYAKSQYEAKQIVDKMLIENGWTLLEEGDRLLTLL
jgi:hypothetical protein